MGVELTARTIATYDAVAAQYLERWRDRSLVQEHIERFSAMLTAYDMADRMVLDIGCGPGFDAALLRYNGLSVAGLDLSPGMLAVGNQEYPGPFIQADMRRLPVASSIGGLWVSASLLHVRRTDVPMALAGFADVLLPGGLLYISLKMGQGAGWSNNLYHRPRHFTYWQPEEIDPFFVAAGLSIVDGWEGDGENDRWLVRYARKPELPSGYQLPCGGPSSAS